MTDQLLTRLEASVDYITITTNDQGHMEALGAFLEETKEEFKSAGNRVQPLKLHQYDGVQVGPLYYGYRLKESLMVRVSGQFADECWDILVENAVNVTRLDIAVTFEYNQVDMQYVRTLYEAVEKKTAGNDITQDYGLRLNLNHGDTLYVGRRKSDWFGRVYDKGAEQGGFQGTKFRFEIETKKRVATPLARQLLAGRGSYRNHIVSIVEQWFTRREVDVPFTSGEVAEMPQSKRRPSDDERYLQWFRHSVARRLKGLIEKGHGAEIAEMLAVPVEFLVEQAPLFNLETTDEGA